MPSSSKSRYRHMPRQSDRKQNKQIPDAPPDVQEAGAAPTVPALGIEDEQDQDAPEWIERLDEEISEESAPDTASGNKLHMIETPDREA